MTIETTIGKWLVMQKSVMHVDENCYEQIKYIDILHVNFKQFAENTRTALEAAIRVGTKPNSSRTLGKVVTQSELLRILRASRYISDNRVRQRAEE